MVSILSKEVHAQIHKCCVPKCLEFGGHRFPKDPVLKKKWMVAMRKRQYLPKWTPHESSRVCRNHFNESDFLKTNKFGFPLRHYRLKPGTIPSKFAWSHSKNEDSSSKKKESKSDFSLSTKKENVKSRNRIKSSVCSRASTFSKKTNIRENTQIAESVMSKAKSKNNVSSTNKETIKTNKNQDVSNWEYRVIRKESLHLEEILGKIEYVFSLQDLNGRELEEKELEEIISSFPPLKPPNQIFPLTSSNQRSKRKC